MLLTTIGVYGIVSYSVAQRTREVGIRMALGALRTRILRMLVGQGMTLVVWGLGIGLLLSFALTRVLTSDLFGSELLFGVTATDSLTFAGVTIILAGGRDRGLLHSRSAGNENRPNRSVEIRIGLRR